MKKILSVICIIAVLFSFAACSAGQTANNTTAPAEGTQASAKIDIATATGQDYIDYFKAIGLFSDGNGYETWLQDHATYWAGTPISECAGWWDDNGTEACVMILVFKDDLADSSKEDYDAWMKQIKENRETVGEGEFVPVLIDHLVGNVAFSYSEMTLNDEQLAKIEAAYEQFVKDAGVTPEF